MVSLESANVNGGGWIRVLNNRSRGLAQRWDTFPWGGGKSNTRGKEADWTSFYVSEFPEETTAKDLLQLFRCVGKATEVSISPRRNNFDK